MSNNNGTCQNQSDGANTINNNYNYNNNDQTHQQHLKQQQASSGSAPVKRELYNGEPEVDYAKELHEVIEGQESLGIIVHCAKEYSAIWCREYGLVRIQIGQDPNLPKWPIAQWVYFRCMQEWSQLQGGVRCSYTAYELRKAEDVFRDAMPIGKSLAVRMSLTKAEAHTSTSFLAQDDLFGPILCSLRDSQFTNQFDHDGKDAQTPIYAMYSDDYRSSKWVAFAYKNGETFKKPILLHLLKFANKSLLLLNLPMA